MEEPVSMAGSASERVLVVLTGTCQLTWGPRAQRLGPSDVVEVPAGPFIFTSDGPVTFMAIYRLPAELWPN